MYANITLLPSDNTTPTRPDLDVAPLRQAHRHNRTDTHRVPVTTRLREALTLLVRGRTSASSHSTGDITLTS